MLKLNRRHFSVLKGKKLYLK